MTGPAAPAGPVPEEAELEVALRQARIAQTPPSTPDDDTA